MDSLPIVIDGVGKETKETCNMFKHLRNLQLSEFRVLLYFSQLAANCTSRIALFCLQPKLAENSFEIEEK